jgi:N-acetylglucosamine kinase-like BadF-type ATPase
MLGIGFDSGGSRTSYALNRGEGPVHVSGNEAGASIANARDAGSVRRSIDWIVEVIRAQDDPEICVWIGAAGFSASTANSIAEQFAEPMKALGQWMEEQNRHCEVFIANDAVSILKSPPLLGAGIVAIVGTGSVVMGTHPSCPDGVVKRGGYEWLVSDEGSGVWMTLQCTRLLLHDIETRGPSEYHSALLDRLADFVGITEDEISGIPASHRALAKIDLIARRMSGSRPDAKRFFANFVYPHIFDLAALQPGRPHDPIAADVINQSIEHIVSSVSSVANVLAAHTADEPNLRESLPLIVGGSIAANPLYDQLFRAKTSSATRFVSSIDLIGDAAEHYAHLCLHYLESDGRTQRAVAKDFDPLHPVMKLL